MRVAHLSDLHLLDLEGAVPFRLLNKRLTGYANLRLRRGHKHKPHPVRLGAQKLKSLGVDHLVVTGDVSNLALEREFDRVRDLLEGETGLAPEQISLVPGNHDAYTRGAVREGRFARWFEPYTRCDLPQASGDSAFPFVRLRGPLAIIGLSTAVPQLPFVAAGRLGAPQLLALAAILAHPEVKSRTPVILQHHPIDNPPGWLKQKLEGLSDADAQLGVLRDVEDGVLLHGHWHKRMRRSVATGKGQLDVIGATSASLLHEDPAKMAGFNVYDFDDKGKLTRVTTQRFQPHDESFDESDLHH